MIGQSGFMSQSSEDKPKHKVGWMWMTDEERQRFKRWLQDMDDKVRSYERVVHEKNRRVY